MKLLLLSHASMALGMHSACEMILGKQDRILALGLDGEAGADTFDASVQSILSGIHEPCLVLSDLYFGSPFNIALRQILQLSEHNDVRIICGMNLPMLLEAVSVMQTEEDPEIDAVVRRIMEAGREGICLYRDAPAVENYSDDEL